MQDDVIAARPDLDVKLIPAGYIISGLLTQFPQLVAIPSTELYEDPDPHGEPTMYFLTGLVHYMVFYGQKPDNSYNVPTSVHPAVQANFTEIVNYVWTELGLFVRPDGSSRVF